MAHKFLIHRSGDHVGVATEPITAGETVIGVVMADDSTVEITALGDVPLGHKLAIEDVPPGGTVLKYGIPIGLSDDGLAVGDYVHTHNLRSARW